MKQDELLDYQVTFDKALASPVGVELTFEIGDLPPLKRKLYAARKELITSGLTQYEVLSFTTPPTNAETSIWITKNVVSS